MANKKTKIILLIITISILLIALAFLIWWKSTEIDRQREGAVAEIQDQLKEYRDKSRYFLELPLADELMEDADFQNFVVSQVQQIFANKEYKLLDEFLRNFEVNDLHCEYLLNAVLAGFKNAKTIEDACEIRDTLLFRRYYNSGIKITRDSEFVASYISQNGTKDITKTPGTGYYANQTDERFDKTIGVTESPLYDATSITYMGDFKCVYKFGVKLDTYYQESSYGNKQYYFRDQQIPISPDEAEYVWSGEYLLYFYPNGDLGGFVKL